MLVERRNGLRVRCPLLAAHCGVSVQLRSSNDMDTAEESTEANVKIKLLPAKSAEDRKRNIIANIVVVEGSNGGGATVPYIDEAVVSATKVTALKAEVAPTKPRLRYYAAGPSTYRIKCPLCRQRADASVVRAACLKDPTCWLSLLSCFVPVLWVCCICSWCGCNREWVARGLYCSQCGGKLGIQQKAK